MRPSIADLTVWCDDLDGPWHGDGVAVRPAGVASPPPVAADADAVEVGVALVESGHVDSEARLAVRGADGRVGTVRVGDVLAAVAQAIRDGLHAADRVRHHFRALIETSSDVLMVLDAQARIIYLSGSALRLFGFDPDEWIGRRASDALHPDDRAHLRRLFENSVAHPGQSLTDTTRLTDGSGRSRYFELTVTNRFHDENVGGIVVNYHDVTDQRALEAQLRRRATVDDLTGLANRPALREFLDHHVALADATNRLGLLLLDLDGFKAINDRFGHLVGDDVLHVVGRRLDRLAGPDDLTSRLGGDEYAVAMPDVTPTRLWERAGEIVAALQEPVTVDGRHLLVHASVGMAFTDRPIGREELLRRADVAMYAAKAGGRNRAAGWSTALDERSNRLGALAGDLKVMLDGDRLDLHYQPIVAAADGRVIGAEALLRWPAHLDRIGPGEMVAVAEQQGLMWELTSWVIDRACRDRARWPAAATGVGIPRVSVNVSPTDLERPEIVDVVAEACARHGLGHQALQIEITESELSRNLAEVGRQLDRLRRQGVSVAVDDFGSGYSSLGQLGAVPADVLKIDRSLVSRLGVGPRALLLVRTVVDLAAGFDLRTVAEGVETEEQAALLREAGVDALQGFLLARPGPAALLRLGGAPVPTG